MLNFSFLDYLCVGYFNIHLQNACSVPDTMLSVERQEQMRQSFPSRSLSVGGRTTAAQRGNKVQPRME